MLGFTGLVSWKFYRNSIRRERRGERQATEDITRLIEDS
jgi:hypothetical protein